MVRVVELFSEFAEDRMDVEGQTRLEGQKKMRVE